MASLMNIAFQDPYYLRYRFKPNCNLLDEITMQTAGNITIRLPHFNQTKHQLGIINSSANQDYAFARDSISNLLNTTHMTGGTGELTTTSSATLSNAIIFWSNTIILLFFMIVFVFMM